MTEVDVVGNDNWRPNALAILEDLKDGLAMAGPGRTLKLTLDQGKVENLVAAFETAPDYRLVWALTHAIRRLDRAADLLDDQVGPFWPWGRKRRQRIMAASVKAAEAAGMARVVLDDVKRWKESTDAL
jgi:hypothetical protein